MNGVVKNVIANRNFGFIRENGSKTEYFFHRDDFNGHWEDLQEDARNGMQIPVEFDTTPNTGKGPRAAKVRRIDFPNEG